MSSVCGRKGHSAEICANVVAASACKADASGSDGDRIIIGEQDAFVCDAPGKSFSDSGEGDRSALSWQIGSLPVICDSGASCHMFQSSIGILSVSHMSTMPTVDVGKVTRTNIGPW